MYIYTSLAEELNTHSLQLWLQWGKAQLYKSFHSSSLWKPQIHRLLCLSTSFSNLKSIFPVYPLLTAAQTTGGQMLFTCFRSSPFFLQNPLWGGAPHLSTQLGRLPPGCFHRFFQRGLFKLSLGFHLCFPSMTSLSFWTRTTPKVGHSWGKLRQLAEIRSWKLFWMRVIVSWLKCL